MASLNKVLITKYNLELSKEEIVLLYSILGHVGVVGSNENEYKFRVLVQNLLESLKCKFKNYNEIDGYFHNFLNRDARNLIFEGKDLYTKFQKYVETIDID